MRAVVLREFGSTGCLRPAEVPSPAGRPGEVVVRLRASALNWHDVLVRQGRYGSPLPHVPGADGAGVLDTGDEVVILPSLGWGAGEAAPASGFEILGDHRPGTYAEAVSVPAENVVPKPRGYSWAEAAALPLVGVTAFRALFTRAGLRSGESLLVLGAGGGVATTAVLLGAAAGATVCVTSSSDAKIEQAREIGATAGVRYTEPDWPTAARELTPGGFDVVLDPVGAWQDSLRALKPGGRLVVLGASRAEQVPLDVRSFYFGQFSLLGTTMGSPRDFAALLAFLAEHDVPPPVVDRTFPLDEAAAAHEYLESGDGFGKVVLTH
ncbi:zinc-binding dehydrogenase [Amycolatopsis sp. NBC_01488]|uniref:zinc-binding dehydrogenase n=1 Tax=Amycolatopsis sp. NBC_01488 TaxID=2903563 RepID=UPI002E2A19BA|nr:zinc-binding dehydrogenase [Amycolatopsis sp. NBC_01488]